ncbi:CBO0543 family protein [Bacillaceae bacterium IKA-2]|nr:CBO0543 family protein [Bacillaceae bacterium IKA-2]
MSKDRGILILIWLVTIGLLYNYIPKNKIRHAVLVYLFKQTITWFFGMFVVEMKLIKYPIKLFFENTNKASFSFEYFFFPSLCAIFNLNYPEKKNKIIKLLYYFFHTGLLTGLEVILERYTNLIKYIKWKWYWTFITIGSTYYLSRRFYLWFFKSEVNSEKFSEK